MSDEPLAVRQQSIYGAPLTEPGFFRVLELHPGSASEKLKGRLGTTRLGDKLPFEAISYRCTEPSRTDPCLIEIGGIDLPIGQSLHDALAHFRGEAKPRRLWADQVCIQQGSKPEIFDQMKIFADILSLASKVLIWLGPGNAETEKGLELFVNVLNRLQARDQHLMSLNPGQQPDAFADVVTSRSNDAITLKAFFAQVWFTRVWTLQEAALAKEAEVWCGDKVLPFPLFEEFQTSIQNDTAGHWANAIQNINAGRGGADPENPDRTSVNALHTISFLKLNAHLTPVRVLNTMRKLDSTKHVDRIRSILRFLPDHLVGELELHQHVDNPALLFTLVAANQLATNKVDFLGAAGLTYQRWSYRDGTESTDRPFLELPSWVADWTFTVRGHSLWVVNDDCKQKRGTPLFRAGADLLDGHSLSVSEHRVVLRLQAKVLPDTVGDCAEPYVVLLSPESPAGFTNVFQFVNEGFQPLDN